MKELQFDVLDEICFWAVWHWNRRRARQIPDEHCALEGIVDASSDLTNALQSNLPDEDIDRLQQALHSAIWTAKSVAEDAYGGGRCAEARCQAEEVETSFLRGWARCFDDLEHMRRTIRDEPANADRLRVEALESLIWSAPPRERYAPE